MVVEVVVVIMTIVSCHVTSFNEWGTCTCCFMGRPTLDGLFPASWGNFLRCSIGLTTPDVACPTVTL